MLAELKKRYWVYRSSSYECGLGMSDFHASFETYDAAVKAATEAFEWSALFDSHTGGQTNFYGD